MNVFFWCLPRPIKETERELITKKLNRFGRKVTFLYYEIAIESNPIGLNNF